MASHGCSFCNDLRNIEPASYIGTTNQDKEFQEFINKARKEKKFIYHYKTNKGTMCVIVDECPECGYKFTKADYDSCYAY